MPARWTWSEPEPESPNRRLDELFAARSASPVGWRALAVATAAILLSHYVVSKAEDRMTQGLGGEESRSDGTATPTELVERPTPD